MSPISPVRMRSCSTSPCVKVSENEHAKLWEPANTSTHSSKTFVYENLPSPTADATIPLHAPPQSIKPTHYGMATTLPLALTATCFFFPALRADLKRIMLGNTTRLHWCFPQKTWHPLNCPRARPLMLRNQCLCQGIQPRERQSLHPMQRDMRITVPDGGGVSEHLSVPTPYIGDASCSHCKIGQTFLAVLPTHLAHCCSSTCCLPCTPYNLQRQLGPGHHNETLHPPTITAPVIDCILGKEAADLPFHVRHSP